MTSLINYPAVADATTVSNCSARILGGRGGTPIDVVIVTTYNVVNVVTRSVKRFASKFRRNFRPADE